MRKILHIALLSIIGLYSAQAQLYVQPTAGPSPNASYIYANDTFIFVTEDIELVSNDGSDIPLSPSIALRNQSQLLQGNDGAINQGSGEISVFQEGTTDNFHYNFWSSPVGTSEEDDGSGSITTTAPGNNFFSMKDGQENIHYPLSVLNSNPALKTNGYDGTSMNGFLSISTFWLFSYQSTTTTSGSTNASWSEVKDQNELNAGWGFSMKGVSGTDNTDVGESSTNNPGGNQRYDFRGRANNGTITGVTVGRDQNSLIGNPYPSALDLSYFLLENSDDGSGGSYDCPQTGTSTTITRRDVTTGIAYFWDSNPAVQSHNLQDYQGGYGTFSPMNSICTDGVYVAAPFYLYDNQGGETGGQNGSGGLYDRRFSPVGQGFFVVGSPTQPLTAGSDEILFSNRHRVYVQEGNNSDFKTNANSSAAVAGIGVDVSYNDVNNLAPLSHLYMKVGINDTYTRELALALLDNATPEVDRGMDAANRGPLATDVSFDIAGAIGNEKENGFVINGVPFGEDQMIPLLIKAESLSEFKFKITETTDFPYSEIFLYDAHTDIYHDILHDEALLLLDQDLYTERFYIRFTKNSEEEEEEETTEEEEEEEEETTEDQDEEGTGEDEDTTSNDTEEEDTQETNEDTTTDDQTNSNEDENESTDGTSDDNDPISEEEQSPFIEESILESFTIIQNNSNRQLEIYNPQNTEVSDVTLYDLTGKKIFNKINLGGQSEFKFPTGNLATGVYVVQFVTKSGLRKGRKISIVN